MTDSTQLTIDLMRELNFDDSKNSLFCKYCNTVKPFSDFYQKSKSKCKECIKISVKKYRENNTEKTRKYAKERYQNNPDVKELTKNRARAYWRDNKERMLKLQKIRRRKDKLRSEYRDNA